MKTNSLPEAMEAHSKTELVLRDGQAQMGKLAEAINTAISQGHFTVDLNVKAFSQPDYVLQQLWDKGYFAVRENEANYDIIKVSWENPEEPNKSDQ